jgi:hypothetical protein
MNKILFLIYLCILFASFCCCIINRKNLPAYFRFFILFTGVTFIVESIGFYLLFYTPRQTYFLYHFYVPFEYAVLALVYSKAISKSWKKKVILISVPAFWLLHLFLSLFIQKIEGDNSYAIMVSLILIVVLSLGYYYELLQKEGSAPLFRDPLFWISTGNLIFYSGVFFLMGFLQYLAKEDLALAKKLMVINYSLNYILYSLYSIGFLCTTQNRKFSLS